MIDGYLDTMRTEIRWRRDLDDVVGEIEDHLYSTVEGMLATGLEPDAAQRATLDRFGEPRYLAALYASTTSGGIAVPTTTTTRAGTLALFAAASWLVMVPFFVYGLATDHKDDAGIAVYLIWALSVGVAGVLGMFVLIALGKRHGGFGVAGMVAIAVTGLGVAMSIVVTWAGPAWMGLTGVGYLIIGLLMFGRDLAPKIATFLFSVGMLAGVAAFFIANAAEWGPLDSYGDYPYAFDISYIVGQGITALGLIGIGLWLKREEPVDMMDSALTA